VEGEQTREDEKRVDTKLGHNLAVHDSLLFKERSHDACDNEYLRLRDDDEVNIELKRMPCSFGHDEIWVFK
jgi:hypothetical protein